MAPKTTDILDKCHQVTESVRKNIFLLNETNPDEIDINAMVGINNRVILSDNKAFLEAVRKEIGGEILEDSVIGPFLYYGEATS